MHRKSGQTTMHIAKRNLSLKERKAIVAELMSDRETYTERLDCALAENDLGAAKKWGDWIEDCNEALALHEGAMKEAEARRAITRRAIQKRIDTFSALMQAAEREIDRASYQALITNERRALNAHRAA